MSTLISKVEDVFQLTGRGCIVAPGILHSTDAPTLRVGDVVILKRPDGSEIQTVIRGMEMGGRVLSRKSTPLLLGEEITKDMIPVGTELWTK